MTTLFIKLLNMSIAASWLVLAVILLRIILKNAPKWIRCILWGLVAVRLICPISIESIFSLLPSAETIPQDIMYVERPTIHTGVMAINSAVNPYISESMAPEIGDSVNPMQVVMSLAAFVWVVGMIGMFVYVFVSFLRIKNKAEASLPVGENVYLSDYIDTPFVLGILHPRIYLPSALAEDDKAEFVIAHEKAHIRRHDHWWKPMGFLLLTIYWFNPVIWIAYILLCRDIELACDEYVIGGFKEKEKKNYTDALLSCSMRSSGYYRNMISACPLAFGEVGVKDRVKAVLHYKKPAFWLVVLGVLGCIIAAVCFLTDPKENTSNAPEPFGHSYRVAEVVYGDPRYSFVYTPDNAPRYQFTSDYAMFVSGDVLDNAEGEEWSQLWGEFEEVKLSPLIFDDYFKSPLDGPTSMIGPDTIRVNAEKAWRIDVQDSDNGLFYYFIQTKQGEVYLTYGYDEGDSYAASEDGSLIGWVFQLVRTDILSCNAVSEDCNAYIEAAYYPNGFNWDYEQLPQGYINEKGVLVFTADWDTDLLVVSEDYYNNFHSGNRSDSTRIEKEVYTLERNKEGQFELDVELRSANGDMAVYFVQAPEGVYVMKIIFADDTAALDIAIKQGTSAVDGKYANEAKGVSISDVTETTVDEAAIKWSDGLIFEELPPGEEVYSDFEITIEENASVMLTIGWTRTGLFMEYGIRSEKGAEFFQEKQGGTSRILIENVPAGTYRLYAKNSDAYAGLPAYENPEEYDVSFNSTGVMLYSIVGAADFEMHRAEKENEYVKYIRGYSALYSEELIERAFKVVEESFSQNFKGCTLKLLQYDEVVENRFADIIMDYATEKGQELIVILSSFETDENGGDGSLNPNDTYTDYQWHLVRSEDKKSWELISWGY